MIIRLRAVIESDLPIFFEHQRDPAALALAAFRTRTREAFDAHWAKTLKDPTNILRTIEVNGEVAGDVGSWEADGKRLVGYWLGAEFWGRGIGTEALRLFVNEQPSRPLFAHVVSSNRRSIRVLEKCGFAFMSSRPPIPEDPVEELLFRLD